MRRTLILLACLGCDDAPGTSGADAGAGCTTSDLIAQCPAGSNPLLGAQAAAACEGAASGVIEDRTGQATGQCYGVGSCRVACQFAVPCRCGVASVTREGVVCADCEGAASCGNDVCEGGETPENCPIDCGAECEPAERRCDGAALQECTLQGRWDTLPCAEGDVCSTDDGPPACVRDPNIVVGSDAGVGGDAGMIDESRVIPGTNIWPEVADLSRGAPAGRLTDAALTVRLDRGCINNRDTPFGMLVSSIRPAIWRLQPGNSGVIEGFGVSGALWLDAMGELIPSPARVAPPTDEAAFCAAFRRCSPERPADTCNTLWSNNIDDPDGPNFLACYAENLQRDCALNTYQCLTTTVHLFPDRTATTGAQVRSGQRVLGASADRSTAVLIDLEDGTVTTHEPLAGFTLLAGEGTLALSADGRIAVFAMAQADQQVVVLWEIATGRRQALLPQAAGNIRRLAISPGGEVMAIHLLGTEDPATDRVLSFWNLADETRIFSLRPLDPQVGIGEMGFEFSPDGRTLAADIGTAVELWALDDTPETTQTLDFDGRQRVQRLRFDPSGRRMATLFTDVSLWDTETGQRMQTFAVLPQGMPRGLEFSEDGQRLLAVQQDAGIAYQFTTFAP